MKRFCMAAIAALAIPVSAQANTIIATQIIDFFDSGAGPLAGPYGGTEFPPNFPIPVPLTYATDGDANTSVSLPTGSFLTLGFTTGTVFDGPGNDIFISEPGQGFEVADVFVSSDGGSTFTFLGEAFGDQLTELDLGAISFTETVNAIRIVGKDNGGGSPGFDVAFVQGLEGSVNIIPLPAGGLLLLSALGGAVMLRRRKRA